MNLEQFTQSNVVQANNVRQRVLKDDAQYLLLSNKSIIVGGTVRYFGIRDLGLGVYEVGLLEKSAYDTRIVEKWIPTLKEDGTKLYPTT